MKLNIQNRKYFYAEYSLHLNYTCRICSYIIQNWITNSFISGFRVKQGEILILTLQFYKQLEMEIEFVRVLKLYSWRTHLNNSLRMYKCPSLTFNYCNIIVCLLQEKILQSFWNFECFWRLINLIQYFNKFYINRPICRLQLDSVNSVGLRWRFAATIWKLCNNCIRHV